MAASDAPNCNEDAPILLNGTISRVVMTQATIAISIALTRMLFAGMISVDII